MNRIIDMKIRDGVWEADLKGTVIFETDMVDISIGSPRRREGIYISSVETGY